MIASVFIAQSLDGYIAREDGSLDWLEYPPVEGEDYGFSAFYSSISAIIIGRKSYEKVLSFPNWPYHGKQVIVLSSTLTDAPEHLQNFVSFYSGDLVSLLDELREDGHNKVYVDGGSTIQAFLKEKLIHDMTITTIPTLIGSGISLFGSIGIDISLRHMKTITYENGFVQTTYEIRH